MLRKGAPITKETFLSHLYGGMDEPEAKIIDVFVCKMRKKLAQAGARDLIGTLWGGGYIIRNPSSLPHSSEIAGTDRAQLLKVA